MSAQCGLQRAQQTTVRKIVQNIPIGPSGSKPNAQFSAENNSQKM
jgi:hypothetical protein